MPCNAIQAITHLFVAHFIEVFIKNTQNFKPLLNSITDQEGQNLEKNKRPGCNKGDHGGKFFKNK